MKKYIEKQIKCWIVVYYDANLKLQLKLFKKEPKILYDDVCMNYKEIIITYYELLDRINK